METRWIALPIFIERDGQKIMIGVAKIEANDGTMMGEISPEYADLFRQEVLGVSIINKEKEENE